VCLSEFLFFVSKYICRKYIQWYSFSSVGRKRGERREEEGRAGEDRGDPQVSN
jgi:hypothetical protein